MTRGVIAGMDIRVSRQAGEPGVRRLAGKAGSEAYPCSRVGGQAGPLGQWDLYSIFPVFSCAGKSGGIPLIY